MCTIHLLWTSDEHHFNINNVFYTPHALAYDITQGGIKIDLVCCAMNLNSIKTAIEVQQYFDHSNSKNKNKNKVYSLPFISDRTQHIDLNDPDLNNLNILHQISTLHDYYELPNHMETFDKHILPIIKELLYVKYYTFLEDKKQEHYVLIITPKKIIDTFFNKDIKPGQFICQTYQYHKILDKTPFYYVKQYIPYFKTHMPMKSHPLSKRLFLI